MMKKNAVKVAAVILTMVFLTGTLPAAVFACSLNSPAVYAPVNEKVQNDDPFGMIDLLIKHEVFHTAEDEDFDEYTIVYYGSSSGKMTGLSLVTKFKKSLGYTKENLMTLDVDEVYPGFSTLDFADYSVEDNGDYVDFIIRFKDLDDMDNMRRMDDIGLIVLESRDADYVIADSFMQDLEDNGYEKMDTADYAGLNLDFSID